MVIDMFFIIFMIGLIYLFIGGIIGEHYRYTIASVILFIFTFKFLPIHDDNAWAMGFSAFFGLIIFTVVLFIVIVIVVSGAGLLKEGILK